MDPRAPGPGAVAEWRALPEREDGSRLELVNGHWLVTAPPTEQHRRAERAILAALERATAAEAQLHVAHEVGVELGATGSTVLVPDFAVFAAPPGSGPVGPEHLVLAGEIWAPASSRRTQWAKRDCFARAGVPFFWSVSQDTRGPVELATYRFDCGRYLTGTATTFGDGPVTITASPVPVEVDVAQLRR